MVETGTAAASAYLVLSSIRGAAAYNIFNQFLYEVCFAQHFENVLLQRCFGLFRQIQRSYTYGSRDNLQLKPVMSKAKGNGKQKVDEVPDGIIF